MQSAWPYCYLWPVQILIFYHIVSQTVRMSKKNLLNIKCVLIFSTNFIWKNFHSKRKWARYDQKLYIGVYVQYLLLVFVYSTCYWCLCTVPAIGVYVQYLLLVFVYSTCYWCLCTVPAIGVYVQYLLLVFMYSTCYWCLCTVPAILVRF